MSNQLKDLFDRFFKSGMMHFEKKEFTVSAENLSKAVFLAIDFLIENKTGLSPKNHEKRFQLVRFNFPDLVSVLDETFSIHKQTYRNVVEEYRAKKVKEYAERLRKKIRKIK